MKDLIVDAMLVEQRLYPQCAFTLVARRIRGIESD
jgi:hypothetical protein